MIIFCITDQNFDEIKSRKQTTVAEVVTNMYRVDNTIKISVNSLAPFAIYKWQNGEHFCISNKLPEISKYIQQFGAQLEYTKKASRYANSKSYVDHTRDCSNVSHITNWKEVSISRTGDIQVISNDAPFTVPLQSEQGVSLFLQWVEKYLSITKTAIRENNFIPSLTGGLDTRILSWFWRDDIDKLSQYYLKALKPCDIADESRGRLEVSIATEVLRQIGVLLERTEDLSCLTLRGIFTENGRKQDSLNDPDFIYDYISLHMSDKNIFYFKEGACPFVDNLYLLLNHPTVHYMRTLFALLFCPDLLDIPLCGFLSQPPYYFKDTFAYLIPEVEEFIKKWDLRNKIAEIKERTK